MRKPPTAPASIFTTMSLFPQAPKPASPVGYHRLLSPSAGVRVSPLCLGAMSFGDAWKGVLGECGKQQSFAILDYYYDHGGNFIDTVSRPLPHLYIMISRLTVFCTHYDMC